MIVDLNKVRTSLLGGLLGSFDGFDFLEEEGSDDSGLDASSAKNTSVGSRDVLVLLGQSLIVVGSELGDAIETAAAFAGVIGRSRSVSSLLDVLDNDSRSGCSDLSDSVGKGVVAESASVGNSLNHLW